MRNLLVTYTNIHCNVEADQSTVQKLTALRATIKAAAVDEHYTTAYASVRVPYDTAMLDAVGTRAQEIGAVDLCVVIGIGGSSLGFRAVYDALQDQATILPHQLLMLETVDTPTTQAALLRIEAALAQNQRVHVTAISKSGATTETLALWRVIQPVLRAHNPDAWHQMVTIITDADSPLDMYACEQNIATLSMPRMVGGRYSIFSPVGLFPLLVCGIDCEALLSGARQAIDEALTLPLEQTFAYKHAVALQGAYAQGYVVQDTFIFSAWCFTVGLWYRQLAAESLGKKRASDNAVFNMIPTVSLGSTDLHSIGQLYLSGARNFWTTFLLVQESDSIKTSNDQSLDRCVASLNNRSLTDIMHAITQGTQKAYQELGVPFSVITLSERSSFTIGYLLQSYMLAIIYAGELLGVDPFNQPDVERYKAITREELLQS